MENIKYLHENFIAIFLDDLGVLMHDRMAPKFWYV